MKIVFLTGVGISAESGFLLLENGLKSIEK